jgi:BioD-like phosphotransacetylase family protein
MKNLYLLNTPGCDHTAVALGLALNFREQGHRVGFLKPVGCPASSGLD